MLQEVYIQGLWEKLKDNLAAQGGTPDLKALICLTTHLDRDRGKSMFSYFLPHTPAGPSGPFQHLSHPHQL